MSMDHPELAPKDIFTETAKKIRDFGRVLSLPHWLRTKDDYRFGSLLQIFCKMHCALFLPPLCWHRDYCWDSLNRVPKSIWHWLIHTILACLSRSPWPQSWSFGSLTYCKYFGSPPCLWIIQSQLQRKPYEREQENRDVGGVLRLPIWLRISQRCFIFLRHAYALLLLRKGSLAALCVLSLGDSIERCDLIFPSNRIGWCHLHYRVAINHGLSNTPRQQGPKHGKFCAHRSACPVPIVVLPLIKVEG